MALSTTKVKSFIERLGTDTQLKAAYEADPDKTLKTQTAEDPKNDVWIYRLVVAALSAIVLIIVCGVLGNITAIESSAKVITIITSLGATALGALAGLLAPSPVKQQS
jgi:hypothetical protein